MSNDTVVMKIKTFTYKRILNLGNYESKHLEATIEVDTYNQGFAEEECSELMDMVERKVREDAATKIKKEIQTLREELRQLESEKQCLVDEINDILRPDMPEIDLDEEDDSEEEEGF